MATIVYTIGDRVFEWDDAKAISNLKKHGVAFEIAAQIFGGLTYCVEARRRDGMERRELTVGKINEAIVIAVVHTDRAGRVRLISARRADRIERARYARELHTSADA